MEIAYIASCVFYLFTPNKFKQKKKLDGNTENTERERERGRENGKESCQNVSRDTTANEGSFACFLRILCV